MSLNNSNRTTDDFPFVSVIMPLHNEGDFIEKSFGAVLEQTYPTQRMEIIVADGMSTDNTRALIEQLKSATEITITIVDNVKQIAPAGLNCALKRARGEIIIRIDGHTIIEPDYISQCVAALERSGAANVGGRMDALSEKKFGKIVALATSSPFGIGNSRFHYSSKEEFVDSVYLGAWRKEVFNQYGLFNEQLVRNQDDEFNYRLRSHGCRILLCPKIKSHYYNRTSIKSLWRQYFQYGYWKVRILQLHPLQMSVRQFVPFIFVLSLITTALLSIFSPLGRWALILLAGSYLTANLIASLMIARKNGLLIFPLLSLSFMILHISYGFGFLVGLISFRNQWGRAEAGSVGQPLNGNSKL